MMTTPTPKRPIEAVTDMEDITGSVVHPHSSTPIVSKHMTHSLSQSDERSLSQSDERSWREVLGPPPPRGVTMVITIFCCNRIT